MRTLGFPRRIFSKEVKLTIVLFSNYSFFSKVWTCPKSPSLAGSWRKRLNKGAFVAPLIPIKSRFYTAGGDRGGAQPFGVGPTSAWSSFNVSGCPVELLHLSLFSRISSRNYGSHRTSFLSLIFNQKPLSWPFAEALLAGSLSPCYATVHSLFHLSFTRHIMLPYLLPLLAS